LKGVLLTQDRCTTKHENEPSNPKVRQTPKGNEGGIEQEREAQRKKRQRRGRGTNRENK